MRKNIIFLWGLLSFAVVACKDPIPDPEQTLLLQPENNTNCLYVSQSSSTASVDFFWEETDHTDAYKLVVKNLTTNEETTSSTVNTSIRLTLSRGVPYQWKVITTAESTSVETPSRTFNFYLEAQQQRNYLPFPANLLSPQANEVIDLTNGTHLFTWEGEDLDNDLSHYALLMGPSIDELNTIATDISATSHQVDLEAGQVYFWQIISYDLNGNNTASLSKRFETAP